MNTYRAKTLLIILLLEFFLFPWTSGCKQKSRDTSPGINLEDPEKKNSIILKVEDTYYFNSDFKNYIRSIVGNNHQDLTIASLSSLYDRFVDEKLLLQEARNQEISLTWEEKKEYLAKLANEYWSEEEEVHQGEIDTNTLFEKLLTEKYTYQIVKDIEVREEEIKEYYNLHKRDFLQAEKVKVSQILVDTENKAIEILDKVKKSTEEEFRKAAQAYSLGAEASKGGDMGSFEMGQLPYEMEKVIFSLKEGELSLVVESSFGYHIFRVDKRYGPELVPLEKASAKIKLKLLEQKMKKVMLQHMEELKKKLDWKAYPQNLPFKFERIIL